MNMMTPFQPAAALQAEMVVNSFGRHAEWLAEYDAAFDFANEVGISESVRTQRCQSLSKIEQKILDTPALNTEEMRAKINTALRINQQGFALDENDSLRLLTESLNWVGRDAQPPECSAESGKTTAVPARGGAWPRAVAAYATARAAELTFYADSVAPAFETDDVTARAIAEARYEELVDGTAAALAEAFRTPASDFSGVLWKLARLAEDEAANETHDRVIAIAGDVRRLSAPKPKASGRVAYSQILQTTATCMTESCRKGDITISELIYYLADIHNYAEQEARALAGSPGTCDAWQTACSVYAEARTLEAQCHNGTPSDEEADRLADARIKAESALMAVPSPNAEAFAYKYLVAFAEQRAAVEYADTLEAEALHFSPMPFPLFSKTDEAA